MAIFEIGNVQVDQLTEPAGGPTSSFGDTVTAPGLDAPASTALLLGTINATGMTIGHTGITVNQNAATTNFSGNVNLTTFTSGSVLFTDGGGLVSQSNSTFFWDNTNKRLGVGTLTPGFTGGVADVPGSKLHVVNSTTHSLLVIESDAANNDAGILIATATNGFDSAIWMDDADSQKLKFSLSNSTAGENNHSDRTGSVRVTITQPGSVGIGTTGPVSKFDVNGNVSIGSYAGSSAAPSNGMIISGTVGIGTPSPSSSYALDVTGTASNSAVRIAIANNSNYTEGVGVYAASLSTGFHVINRFGVAASTGQSGEMSYYYAGNNNANNHVAISHYNTGEMAHFMQSGDVALGGVITPGTTTTNATLIIKANGTVGIGAASSGSALYVQGSSASSSYISVVDTTGNNNAILGSADSPSAYGFVGNLTNDPFIFRVNNAEVARFDTSGRFGIGSTFAGWQPAYTLDIRSSTAGSTVHIRSNAATDDGAYVISDQASQAVLSGGMSFNGTSWVAKATSASTMDLVGGDTSFYNGTGLTIGNTFSPTIRFVIKADGGVEYSNSTSAAVSASNAGRIRYNSTAQHFEVSENTGAYAKMCSIPSSVSDFQLTTTSATTIATFTPPAQGNYRVDIYYRVVTATTNVTITLTWTDGSGAQTSNIVPLTSTSVGSYIIPPTYLNSTAAAITVSATSGTANNLYVSASIGGA